MVDQPVWAVCLYTEGGSRDGECLIEFVRAADRDDAVSQAINLNQTGDEDGFQVNAAAQMPDEVY